MYETGSLSVEVEKKNNRFGGFLNSFKKHIRADDMRVIPADELLRNNGLAKTALLLLMGNIGSGILTVPYAFTKVGFVPGVTICIIMALVSRYSGVLLARTYLENQDCHTMGAIAERLGGPRLSWFVYSGVYLYMFVMLSYYLVIAAKSIEDINKMCIYTAALYAGVIILPFLQLRTLGEISWLGIFSFLSIFVVVSICLQQAGDYDAEVTYSWFQIASVFDLFSATGTIGFAYCGQFMYVEMMYEMRDPKEFITALNITVTIMFVTYTATGILGYYLLGDSVPAYLIDVIPSSSIRSTAAIFMIIHIIFTMLPKTQVLTRVLHHKVDIASVDAFHYTSEMFLRATRYWFLISIILFIALFAVVNTIPYFYDLVVLMGCSFDPCLDLIVPTVLFWLLLRQKGRLMSISMKIGWFFGGLLTSGLLIFGTWEAVSNWLENSAEIWTCNPY